MTLTTTTATVTALLLIPIAVSMSNHGTPSMTPRVETASQVVLMNDNQPTPLMVLSQLDGVVEEEVTDRDSTIRQADRAQAGGLEIEIVDEEDRLDLNIIANPVVASQGKRRSWHFRPQSENERRIEEALKHNTELDFVDTPLREAIDYIAQHHNITILIKDEELSDSGVTTDQPVNLSISGVTLESCLNIILEPLRLSYMTQNEVMMITTVDDADANLETRVYQLPASQWVSADQLIDLVQSSVKGNWEVEDGIGGQTTAISNGLVIRQTQRTHREIEALFEQLEAHAAAEAEE